MLVFNHVLASCSSQKQFFPLAQQKAGSELVPLFCATVVAETEKAGSKQIQNPSLQVCRLVEAQ